MIQCSSITNKGQRTHNEDAIGVFTSKDIKGFIVCDGLGGHGMGEVASSATVDLFETAVNSCKTIDETFFEQFFQAAQNKLLNEQKTQNSSNKMKTTVAALIIDENHARIGHIGDSRVYVFSQSSTFFRTFDHSVPEALRRAGMIAESDIRHHPDRNKLLKVLGSAEIDANGSVSDEYDLKSVQAFLLCTDGFWEHITEEKICGLLHSSKSPEEWIGRMTEEVKKNGRKNDNMDNYSAIVVWNISE